MKRLILIIFLIITMFSTTSCMNIERDEKKYCENLLNVEIPQDSIVLNKEDTHGGMHGDGKYVSIIQINKSYLHQFKTSLVTKNNWNTDPIPYELDLFLFGNKSNSYDGICKEIPSNITKYIYFFEDKYVKEYPSEKETYFLNRPAYNIVFSLLDLNTGKLYILEYDT